MTLEEKRAANMVDEGRVRSCADEGLPGSIIAERLGLSVSEVSRIASRLGLKLVPFREWWP